MAHAELTAADLTYISANFVTLESLCASRPENATEVKALTEQGRLPRPSYVLEDRTGMFPADYFRLIDEAGGANELREHFAARHGAASLAQGADPSEVEQDWDAYMNGIYGICLREVTPEGIVRKTALVSSLSELLRLPRPGDPEWRTTLREQVDELDALEREFAPDYDHRVEQEGPPSRDRLIGAARARYPEIFARVA
jgi:hypothetical protein